MLEQMAPEDDIDEEESEVTEEEVSHHQQHRRPDLKPNDLAPTNHARQAKPTPLGTHSKSTSSVGSSATSKQCSMGAESNPASGASYSVAMPATNNLQR